MTSPTASLLQHLLTRSDLARLVIPSSQVDTWLATGALTPVAELPSAGTDGEQVFSVTDDALRADLNARLATVGKSTVLLSPGGIRTFLRGAAGGDVGDDASAPASVTAAVGQLANEDFADLFAAAVAELDGDMEVVVRLAEQAARFESRPTPTARTPRRQLTDTEESMLLDNPIQRRKQVESEWFDTAELAAAMGDLASASAAMDEVGGDGMPLNDLVPLAEDDLEELAAQVAFHSEQIERLVDLPHSIDLLTRQVEDLRKAIQDGEPLPPSISEQAALGTIQNGVDGRRTSLLAIGLALLCWSGLVWFGTGSTTLALVSLTAASVIGLLALQTPDRSR